MVLPARERTEAITVRFTREEKTRLERVAHAEDLRVGQLARRILNEKLSAINIDEPRSASSDAA